MEVSPSTYHRRSIILIALVTLCACLPTFKNGWVNWDDGAYVVNNHVMAAPDALYRIWFTWETKDYYPLTFTFLYAQHALWELNATAFHGVSLFLHIIIAWLTHAVCLRIGLGRGAARFIALVFAIHPVQVESFAWITEQKNLLYALFGWLAVLAYLRFRENSRRSWLLVSLMLFCAGMLSKAMLISLPLILLGCDWLMGRKWSWKSLLAVLPFFILGGLLAFNLVRQQHDMMASRAEENPHTLAERIIIVSYALWFYPWKLLWPTGLTPIYPLWDLNTGQIWSYLPALAWVLVVLVIVALYLSGRISRKIPFGLFFYFVTVAPVIGLLDTSYMSLSFVSDRYQYTPCLGLLIIIGALFSKEKRQDAVVSSAVTHRAGLVTVLASLTVLALASMTWYQVQVWRSSVSLWSHCVKHTTSSARPRALLGSGHVIAGDFDLAEESFRLALELDPDDPHALLGIGNLDLQRGNIPSAVQYLNRALEVAPQRAPAHLCLGLALFEQGNVEEAIQSIRRALELKPFYIHALQESVRMLRLAGQSEEAARDAARLRELGVETDESSSNS